MMKRDGTQAMLSVGTRLLVGVGAATLLLGACEQEPTFAVNQRIFVLPGMESAGSGCFHFQPSRHSQGGTGTGGGGDGSPLAVDVETGENVIVRVSEGGRLLIERTYDEEFFRSGRPDEFTVTASTGHRRLLRYWSSFGAGGGPQCAPLEQLGPTPPSP